QVVELHFDSSSGVVPAPSDAAAALVRDALASGTSSTLTRKRTCRTIPRVAGLSGISTVWPMRSRPSARIVPRLRAMWLIVLLVWVTRSLPGIGHLRGRVRGGTLAADSAGEADAPGPAQPVPRAQAPPGPRRAHGPRY